jgi:hypothetical protein
MCLRVLSIDVGIKNLAFCLFEKQPNSSHFNIVKWDIVNLSQEDELLKCSYNDKNNKCDKPAKYTTVNSDSDNNKCFCLKHAKKQSYQMPTSEMKSSFINKQKIQKLIEIADKYDIHYEKPMKKNDLIFKINEYISNKCFKEITTTNADQIDLITIGKNIKNKFNKIFPPEDMIQYVLIENQISPIANRMKTIQGMISQYFIMNNNVEHIEFISSINKLKFCDINKKKKQTQIQDNEVNQDQIHEQTQHQTQNKKEPSKNDYKSRKKQGIAKCLELLTTDYRFNNQICFFNEHKKKDDLSDAFLQGLWFITNKKI